MFIAIFFKYAILFLGDFMTNKEILQRLYSMQDVKYKQFQSKLVPNVNGNTIIGIRTPQLRCFANELFKAGNYDGFLNSLPHKYYEENNLHAFLIEKISDFDKATAYLNKFLPYVDNWATCDSMSPKIFKKHKEKLLNITKEWIKSNDTYTVRFGIICFMRHFLDDDFSIEYLDLISSVKSDEYYVKMGVAWYFATALAKQYDDAVQYIENQKLDKWTHNKAIQKAVESYRITPQQKQYLKTLKL